jgi:hypothetical protein
MVRPQCSFVAGGLLPRRLSRWTGSAISPALLLSRFCFSTWTCDATLRTLLCHPARQTGSFGDGVHQGIYSASSAYTAFLLGQTALAGAKELWKTKVPNKCRFFYWPVLHGRCWTSDCLQCHGLSNNGLYAPCAPSMPRQSITF